MSAEAHMVQGSKFVIIIHSFIHLAKLIITNNKQIALGVLTADCCPIFIFDKDLYQWELIYSSTDSQNNFYRGLGVVNMVKAIKNNTVSEDELSVPFHILEVMCALDSYNLDSGWKKIIQQF